MNATHNYRDTVLTEMHNAWMFDESGDMEQAANRVKNIMQRHKLTFKAHKDIEPLYQIMYSQKIDEFFFECLNSPKYELLREFSWLCESYMNFEKVLNKVNNDTYAAHYQSKYGAIAIAEHHEGLTLVSPVQRAN